MKCVKYLFLLLFFVSCGQGNNNPSTLTFGLQVKDCGVKSYQSTGLPSGVDKIVILAQGKKTHQKQKLVITKDQISQGPVILKNLKPDTYDVDVVACSGKSPAYGNTVRNIQVEKHEKSFVKAYLMPLGRLSCIGGLNTSPLYPAFSGEDFMDNGKGAFSCVTKGGDGNIWIVGGFSSITPRYPGSGKLKGSTNIWIYDVESGLFYKPEDSKGNYIGLPDYGLGAMACFGAGKGVIAFGGAMDGEVGPDDYPGIVPPVKVYPSDAIASTGYYITAGSIKKFSINPPVYPYSATAVVKGRMISCGGQTPALSAMDSCTLIGFDKGAPYSKPFGKLNVPRYGASAVALPDGAILIVGGYNPDEDTSVPEVIRTDGSSMPLNIKVEPTAFAAATLISGKDKWRILVIGGNAVTKGGDKYQFSGVKSGFAYVIDIPVVNSKADYSKASYKKLTVLSTKDTEGGNWAGVSYASLLNLNGELILGYGFRAFSSEKISVNGKNVIEQMCTGPDGEDVGNCFPKTIRFLSLNGDKLGVKKTIFDTSARLGAGGIIFNNSGILFYSGVRFKIVKTGDNKKKVVTYIDPAASIYMSVPSRYTEVCGGK